MGGCSWLASCPSSLSSSSSRGATTAADLAVPDGLLAACSTLGGGVWDGLGAGTAADLAHQCIRRPDTELTEMWAAGTCCRQDLVSWTGTGARVRLELHVDDEQHAHRQAGGEADRQGEGKAASGAALRG
jgi:hypothetical protein